MLKTNYYLRSKWLWSLTMGVFGIAPSQHCAQSAFCPAMVGIRPLLGSFHWLAFRRSAFGHTPVGSGYRYYGDSWPAFLLRGV